MKKPISYKAGMVQPSPTLSIDERFKSMKQQGLDVVGFGAGEPDFETPQYIKDAAIDAINRGKTRYTPASGIMRLKYAICDKLRRDNNIVYEPKDIVVSNGAKHSVFNALTTICNPGEEVILPSPYWVSYSELIRMAGGIPVIVKAREADHFKMSAAQLRAAITPRTKALLLNTPNNPTGMVYSRRELEEFAEICVEYGLYVISDEIYEKIIYDGHEHVSIASLGDEIKDQTITINGVSKAYAMTGWRIGYTASNEEIALMMSNFQSHSASNPNSIAQYAAYAAYTGPQDEVAKMCAAFKQRRDYMVERINSIEGVSCIMPNGAFYVMMNIKELLGQSLYGVVIDGADTFSELLLDKARVAVVPCTGFGTAKFVRWSYAASMDSIKEGLDRLELFLKEKYDDKKHSDQF